MNQAGQRNVDIDTGAALGSNDFFIRGYDRKTGEVVFQVQDGTSKNDWANGATRSEPTEN